MPRDRARAGPGFDVDAAWPVEVLLPDPLPVRLAEILAIERFFADLVDAALAPQTCADRTTAIGGGQRVGSTSPARSRPRARRRAR